MLYKQALRGCVEPSGDRMSAPIRKQILTYLSGTALTHPDDSSRVAGSGCLGALCKWLPEDDLKSIMSEHLIVDSASAEWTLRHGRSTALFVALKLCPDRIYNESTAPKLEKTLLSLLQADRVPVAENGVRATCYLFCHCRQSGQAVPAALIGPYAKAINHASNDVKQLVAVTANHLAKSSGDAVLPVELLRPLLPALVNGTKEKNSLVKSSSESALVSMLHMRRADSKTVVAQCLGVLDGGAKDALQVSETLDIGQTLLVLP